MQNVAKPGMQPPACPLEDCERPPHNGQVGEYCKPHRDYFDRQNGTASTPPVIEVDDPQLLEREAKKAAAAEQAEYAERRRVKTWKVLDNGSRVPEEYWSAEELEAIEAEAQRTALDMNVRLARTSLPMNQTFYDDALASRRAMANPVRDADPVKDATRFFKACLRGKKGELAKAMAWSTMRTLGDIAE